LQVFDDPMKLPFPSPAVGLGLVFGWATLSAPAQSEALLDQWIAAQTNLLTWSADAVQTRTLKTLTQPLVSTGKVWMIPPDQFRWELGQPAQTIALRRREELFLVYPRLKRVEKYPLTGHSSGPWHDALALLDASFPRSRADLAAHFQLLSVIQTNGQLQVRLQPKSPSARQFLTEISVRVYTNDFSPAATELIFSDGSSLRNEFTHGVVNRPIEASRFAVTSDTNFTVVEPLGP